MIRHERPAELAGYLSIFTGKVRGCSVRYAVIVMLCYAQLFLIVYQQYRLDDCE